MLAQQTPVFAPWAVPFRNRRPLCLPSVLLLACATLPSHAQTGFQGFSPGSQVGFMNAAIDLTIPDDEGNDHHEFGAQSRPIGFRANYSLTLDEQIDRGIGTSDRPGFTPAGSSIPEKNIPMQLELRNLRTNAVKPGYTLQPNTLIYGRFAYSGTKVVLSVSGDDGAQKLSKPLTSYGLGLGLGLQF